MPASFEYAANMPGYPRTIPSYVEYAANMSEYPCTIPPHVAEYIANIPADFLMPRIYRVNIIGVLSSNKYGM